MYKKSNLLPLTSYLLPLTLYLQLSIKHFVPGETFLVEELHEGVGVEFFDVPYAGFAPDTLEEEHGTNHCRYASGVAHTLHARFLVGCLMRAVVIDIVGALFAVFDAADAAADACLALIVLAQILWVGQHSLEEL